MLPAGFGLIGRHFADFDGEFPNERQGFDDGYILMYLNRRVCSEQGTPEER